MGCCFSRPDGPNSPYPGGTATGSSRAINAPPHPSTAGGVPSNGDDATPSSPTAAPGPRQSHRQRHRQQNQPLAQHINKPLRRHEWVSRNRTWTAEQLARERTEFFDTRVTGREEVWQTIKAALEVLRHADTARADDSASPLAETVADSAEEDRTVALATAQTILTAADITLPTGDLANGVYDALGNYYPLPEHVVCDPVNLAPGSREDSKADLAAGDDTADEADLDDEVERRREEKGKAVVDVHDQIVVVVRLSESARDLKLHVGREENVRSIVRKILDEIGHRQNQRIRIAYMGKIMKENASLVTQGWKDGQVINAFMYEHQ